MKLLSRAAAAALMTVALASPCLAGQVRLEIRGGLVTLSAKDASVREILTEWARVGQTRIVNAERVAGGLVTIELNGVPEAKALDIVLRSVAGYVAAPRMAAATAGSRFDRIVIMATARPPAGGASPAIPVATAPAPPPYDPRGRMGGVQPQPAQPSLMVDDQDEPVQPQQQPQPQAAPTAGAGSAPQPGMPTAPPPAMPGAQQPVAPGQAPQATPLPPGQQPNSPAAQRPGVMTPSPPPKPPGSPGGGPGGN